jgi:hypothetical protein
MDSPQNHIWGPNLWIILHSSAERIGIPNHKRLPQEESRIWLNLLSSLRFSLPCPLCKKHYTSYYTSSPIVSFTKESIRNWLYNLHCQVNEKTGKLNEISLENIPEIYNKPFHFSKHLNIITQEMNKALRLNWSSRDDIQKTLRLFGELLRYYDFF